MEKNSNIINAINTSLSNGISFYAFKPYNQGFQFGAQVDSDYSSNEGFKIAPFIINEENPLSNIYKQYSDDEICALFTSQGHLSIHRSIHDYSTDFDTYTLSFEDCQNLIQANELEKIVLSRIIVEEYTQINWGELFIHLTEKYPDAFCFIYNSPQTGAWCGATPELLGRYNGNEFQTMALAGTKPITDETEWDIKNINEQNYVVDFIASILTKYQIDFKLSEKFNKEAGFVKHLCNRFNAEVKDIHTAYDIIRELHPTPALAGTPQNKVVKAIPHVERHAREYYGGYIGYFSQNTFDYYVNLRSMRFDNNQYKLFVGGGITDKSKLDSEWAETQNKSKTLMSILHSQK